MMLEENEISSTLELDSNNLKVKEVESLGESISSNKEFFSGVNGCWSRATLEKLVTESGLCPLTPTPERESSGTSSSSGTDDFDQDLLFSSYPTPCECIFNPFAPGPNMLAFAPKKKIHLKERRTPICQKLNFDANDSDSDEKEEDLLVESIYSILLDIVLANQFMGISENLVMGSYSPAILKTPSSPYLNFVTETCPDAPLKHNMKVERSTAGICRKLEF